MASPIVLCLLFAISAASSSNVHTAVETEMFAIPISPNLFNWTYQEFDQQYRFHTSLLGKPELPAWLRYIYSGRHHSGFIYGTPPRGTKKPITLEVIGLNRQDYETRRVQLTLELQPKENLARYEVELKIDNLNVEDLLDEHRMTRLKDILRTKLWLESHQDLYCTFLASAIDMGARLPLKPEDGEGLVVRLGSSVPFSFDLKELREEVRPLSRLPSCPREYKRTTRERLFRDAGLTLDWCSFELFNTIYHERKTEHIEYLAEVPNTKKTTYKSAEADIWSAPSRHALPSRSYARQLFGVLAVPVLLFTLSIAALTTVACYHQAAVDPVSHTFYENIFHICTDYKSRRAHRSANVEQCRYNTGNTAQTQAQDNTSEKSQQGSSPNNSLPRPYSPKSTPNLAGNYNRPQPPPYSGSTIHHRKSTIDLTPSTSGHTPEHRIALEESLKLLNDATITKDFDLKNPVVDIDDGAEDYVPIKPDSSGYISMKADLDDIDVPDLAKFGVGM